MPLSSSFFLLLPLVAPAQDVDANRVYTVSISDLEYNIPLEKTNAESVISTVFQAAAGKTTNTAHEEVTPQASAAVRSALDWVRRLTPVDAAIVDSLDYRLTGEITKATTTTRDVVTTTKDKNGKDITKVETQFEATVGITLSLRDLSTGEIASHTFSATSGSFGLSSQAQALSDCCDRLASLVADYYNGLFPLRGHILEKGNEKKDKAKEVYIDLGQATATDKDDHFEVFQLGSVAGRETRKLIGRLKVAEVLGPDISLCKVEKGGKEIKAALDAGDSLYIVSLD